MLLLGAGRIGTGLFRAAQDNGLQADLISRNSGWEALEAPAGRPVVVCTRNDDLKAVVERVPESRQGDLVFVQNGAIRSWLEAAGLQTCGRALLYFAVTERYGAIQPGRASWFTGPHAGALADWMTRLGVEARAVSDAEFQAVEFEKLLWLCLMGPLCMATARPVDVVAREDRGRILALCTELAPLAPGGQVEADALARGICDYSGSLPGYRASVKEWRWRNGWLVERARHLGLPTPLHEQLLQEAGVSLDG